MEAECPSETYVNFHLTTWHHSPEDSILYIYRCEKLKFYIDEIFLCFMTEVGRGKQKRMWMHERGSKGTLELFHNENFTNRALHQMLLGCLIQGEFSTAGRDRKCILRARTTLHHNNNLFIIIPD
jgi:hypothetical protein